MIYAHFSPLASCTIARSRVSVYVYICFVIIFIIIMVCCWAACLLCVCFFLWCFFFCCCCCSCVAHMRCDDEFLGLASSANGMRYIPLSARARVCVVYASTSSIYTHIMRIMYMYTLCEHGVWVCIPSNRLRAKDASARAPASELAMCRHRNSIFAASSRICARASAPE